MQKINFTIYGNQEDPTGNPVGYTRVLNHSWRKDATRYMNWMQFVRTIFYDKVLGGVKFQDYVKNKLLAPIKKSDTDYAVSIKIFWKDGHHADIDNVLKGLLDALFENDKSVSAIAARAETSPEKKGRIEVEILMIGVEVLAKKSKELLKNKK